MTREEAIRHGKEQLEVFGGEHKKFIQMAVEALEQKRGKWIKANIVLTSYPPQFIWNCSNCGEGMQGFNDSVLSDYCPNCGAIMTEKK